MHKVVIKYKNRKTLKALAALGEYLGFTIAHTEKKEKKEKEIYYINNIPVESGDPKVEIEDLTTILTRENINAKTLRESAWQRKG